MKSSRSVNKSALSTTIAVILTAVIVGSVVGGATSYIFSTRSDSMVQELRADVKAVADAAGVPINNPEEMKKLLEERKVIEAAKKEGKVVIYATAGAALMGPQIRAFESRHPFITVEVVYGVPGGTSAGGGLALVSRFIGEFDKGIRYADVFMPDSIATRDTMQRQSELLAKYVPKDSGYVSADLRDRDGRWAASSLVLWPIAYNTKLVPKEQVPKTYRDLIDPKWNGKIGTVDFKASPGYMDLLKAMEKQYGEDFMRQLTAQKIRFYGSVAEALDKLASGEVLIIPNMFPGFVEPRKAAGQPVDWVRTSDNTYLTTFVPLAIASNAPHPNAAKLWVDFAMSKEGSQIRADGGSVSTMPGIRRANPDLGPEGKKFIVSEQQSEDERKAFLAKYPALAP